MQVFTFLPILLLSTACSGPVKKNVPIKNEQTTFIKNMDVTQSGDVRCIIQDKEGNLWFGTRGNGLYKYDGKAFLQFTVTDGLDCDNIYCLLQDKDGKIWIGTEEGLCVYSEQKFSQIKIPLPKNLPPNNNTYYQNHWVFSMIQAKSGKIWFATIDGVYIYDGKSFTHFPMKEAANGFLNSNAKAERLLEDNAGNIWFGCRANEGVFCYDGKSVTHFKLQQLTQGENGPRPKLHNWGWPQLQDKNGNIWFSNWGGIYRYDGKTFTGFSAKDGLAVTMVAKIIEDKKGNFWLNGDELFRYDGKSFTRFTAKDTHAHLGGWSILEDSSGNIWAGTKANGLRIFDGKEFITYSEFKH